MKVGDLVRWKYRIDIIGIVLEIWEHSVEIKWINGTKKIYTHSKEEIELVKNDLNPLILKVLYG